MTKTFAVIGDPIDHSMSPSIHNAAFKELGLDCTYIAYRIPKGELRAGIESLKRIKISGFNVTIPHKIEMMGLLDEASKECKTIGATNTVSNENGRLVGYNTDMDGFLNPIKKKGITITGQSALVLGAGGAARAITAGLSKEMASKIIIANRTMQKAEDLAAFASKLGVESEPILLADAQKSAQKCRFLINTTSIGLRGEPSPIPASAITKDHIVYDIVYMPMNTDFVLQGKKSGAAIIYGYEMLLEQACLSFEIWHRIKAPYDAMKRVLLGGF